MEGLEIGAEVLVKDNHGVVRFIGKTQFAAGDWVGVELDENVGKNDGSVQGVRYFDMSQGTSGDMRGVFVRPTNLVIVGNDNRSTPSSSDAGGSDNTPQMTRLELLVRRLEFKLRTSSEEAKLLKASAHALEVEKQELRAQLAEMEADLERATIDKETLRELSQSLQIQLSELDNNYNMLLQEFAKAKNEVLIRKETEEQLLGVAKQDPEKSSLLVAKNQSLEKSLEHLRISSENKQNDLKIRIEQLEKDNAQVDVLSTMLQDLQRKYDESQQSLSELKSQLALVSESQDLIESLTEKNMFFSEQVTELEQTISQMQEGHERDGDVITKLETQQQKLQKQIEDLLLEKADYEQTLQSHEEERMTIIQEAESLRAQILSRNINPGALDSAESTVQEDIQLKGQRLRELSYQSQVQRIKITKTEARLKFVESKVTDPEVKRAVAALADVLELEQLYEALEVLSESLRQRGSLYGKVSLDVAQLAADFRYVLNSSKFTKDGAEKIADFVSLISANTLDLLEKASSADLKYIGSKVSAIEGDVAFCVEGNLGPEIPREAFIHKLTRVYYPVAEHCTDTLESNPALASRGLLEELFKLCVVLETLTNDLIKKRKAMKDIKAVFFDDSTEFLHALYLELLNGTVAQDKAEEYARNIQNLVESLKAVEIAESGTSVSYFDAILGALKAREEQAQSGLAQAEKLKRDAMDMALRLVSQSKITAELNAKIVSLERRLENTKHSESDLLHVRSRLDVLKSENAKISEERIALQLKNEDLEKKMNQIKRDNKLFGDFGNIYEEKEFAEKAELISEIHSLRKAVSIFHEQRRQKTTRDLAWLGEVYPAPNYIPSKLERDTRELAQTIRGITERFKVLPVGSYNRWRPKLSIPSHYAGVMKEELYNYQALKRAAYTK